MNECAAARVTRVGVDLSKRVYQVHGVDRSGKVVFAKPMSPERFLTWCADLPAGCLVATEACGGAHHVARRLRAMGLDARLIAAHFVARIDSRVRAARTTPTTRPPSAKRPAARICTSCL